jgi:hypothetical protein
VIGTGRRRIALQDKIVRNHTYFDRKNPADRSGAACERYSIKSMSPAVRPLPFQVG